jgi:alanyl-tRNA synthetase
VKLDPKDWSDTVRALVGGGGGGKGNLFTGTGPNVANVKLAVDVARKLLEQHLG